MPYTLLIVDMQRAFEASQKPSVIKNCQSLVAQAMKDKAAVIFLEYKDYGKTHSDITSLTKKYKKAYQVIKYEDDGSNETVKKLKKCKLPERKLRVCGVNTTYCVAATVKGLTSQLPGAKIEVIGKACNSITPSNHKMGLIGLRKLRPNVKVK